MRGSAQGGNSGFLTILLVGMVVTAIALLGTEPPGPVEKDAEAQAVDVAEAPPVFMGALGRLGRSRGIELPQ